MKKHPLTSFIILAITILVFIASISFLWPEDNRLLFNHDLIISEDLNGQILEVTYFDKAKINTEIAYGNTYVKKIKVVNNNDEDIVFAISLLDYEVSNDLLVYEILASTDENEYHELFSEQKIEHENIGYNIQVDKNSTMYLKIVFKGMKEKELTSLKGTLRIVSNISKKELFINNIAKLHQEILKKIDSINGINTTGFYLMSIDNIDANYKGYVLIDASDYSDLKYIYTIWNDKYLLKNFNYSENKISINDLSEKDHDFTSQEVCQLYNHKDCQDFDNLKYRDQGGEKYFKNTVEQILNGAKDKFNAEKHNKVIYIYDINADLENVNANFKGYILIDNRSDKSEYYLYLHNDLFMITGYNITKYGEIDVDSSTIRVYRESAFNMSSESSKKVCEFTKLGDCYMANDEVIS